MDLFKLKDKELDKDDNKLDNINNSILEEDKTDKDKDKDKEENKEKNHLRKLSVWYEFKEFCIELLELLKIDIHNSYLFLIENKNYLVCAIILAILLQFANINNLGTSFEKFCNKNLKGGGGEEAETYRDLKAEERAEKKEAKKQKQAEQLEIKKQAYLKKKENSAKKKKLKGEDKKKYMDEKAKMFDLKAIDGSDLHKSKESSKKAYDADAKEQKRQDNESKANEKRISFFENLKNKFGKGSNLGGEYGALGPVFGNMEKIMDSVKTVFFIVTVILTIAGILSIPVLIFLIITYMVFKTMVGKFLIL